MPADGPAADSDRANPGPLDCCLRQGSWVQLLIARLAAILAAVVLVSCTGAGGAAPSPTALAAPLSGLIHIGLAHWNLTAGYGAGWVGDNVDGSVVRVDARTGATRRYVIGDPKAARRLPTAVLSAFGSVWATKNDTRAVVRLDPDTGKTLATIPVGILPENLGSGEGSIWVDSYEDTRLVRIDPTTNRVAGSFDIVGGAEGVTAFAASGSGHRADHRAHPGRARAGGPRRRLRFPLGCKPAIRECDSYRPSYQLSDRHLASCGQPDAVGAGHRWPLHICRRRVADRPGH